MNRHWDGGAPPFRVIELTCENIEEPEDQSYTDDEIAAKRREAHDALTELQLHERSRITNRIRAVTSFELNYDVQSIQVHKLIYNKQNIIQTYMPYNMPYAPAFLRTARTAYNHGMKAKLKLLIVNLRKRQPTIATPTTFCAHKVLQTNYVCQKYPVRSKTPLYANAHISSIPLG